MGRRTTRLGAAAFVLGMSLAGPTALAGADSPDSDGSTAPANATEPSAGNRSAAARPDTARRMPQPPGPAGSTPTVSAGPRQAPAGPVGERAAVRHRTVGSDTGRRSGSPTVSSTGGAAAGALRTAADRPADPTPEAQTAGPDADLPGTAGSDTDVPDTDGVGAVDVSAGQVASAAGYPHAAPAQSATAAIASASATTTSTMDPLGGLLAPIQSFIEGIALLVRRTFFNDAPTVNPVQLTGQTAGVITGNVGAVDPEGDPITYSLTAAPHFGTVAIAADGSYTYIPGAGFGGTDTFTVAAADTGLHINLLNPFRAAYTLGNAVVTQGLTGPRIQFEFTYAGGAVFWSQDARAALESSATILGSYFVVSAPVTITYSVTGEVSPLSGTLASASSDIISSRPGLFPTVVQNKIISGVDVNGAAPDGTITWNFGNPWAFGATVDNGQYDFQSVAIHELLHTFGFLSNVSAPGTNDGTGWTTFDGLLVTADGTAVINPDYTWNSAYDANLTGGGGGLFLGGPAAIAAYGGPVPVFTPNPWQGGSSMSHLDDMSFYGRNEKLMNARVSTGQGIRTLSTVETAILTDLGYTVVPGPGASVVMLFGVFLLRRRRV